jgi:hypothetical protein
MGGGTEVSALLVIFLTILLVIAVILAAVLVVAIPYILVYATFMYFWRKWAENEY